MTQDIELRPVEYRNGKPTRFEVIQVDSTPPVPAPVTPYIIGHDDRPPMLPPMETEYIIRGTPVDEALAFAIRISWLAFALAAAVAVAVGTFGPSLSSWVLVVAFGAVFAGVWLVAVAVDALKSPGGLQIFHAWRLWRWLDREQAHRHNGGGQ